MPSFERLPSGATTARVKRTRDGTARRWSRTFHTKTAARNWALDLEDLVDQGHSVDRHGEHLCCGRLRASQTTVQELHDTWWAGAGGTMETTYTASTKSRMLVHVLPRWGSMTLAELEQQSEEIEAWLSALQRDVRPGTDKPLSSATALQCLIALRKLIRVAMRKHPPLMTHDPTALLTAPKAGRRSRRHWEREHVDAIVDQLKPPYDVVPLFAAYTGLRWGEIAGLHLEHLHVLARRVDVRWTRPVNGGRSLKAYPKSKMGWRSVPIPEHLAEALAAHLADHRARPCGLEHPGGVACSGLVFTTEAGKPLDHSGFSAKLWHPALKDAQVPAGTFHDLRHTYCSWLVAGGETLETVRVLAGHEDLKTTQGYAHFAPDHGLGAVSVLERKNAPGRRRAGGG